MAAISTLLSPNLLQPTKPFATLQQPPSRLPLYAVKLQNLKSSINFSVSHLGLNPRELPRRVYAVAEETAVLTQDPKSEAARRLYVGNIPRTVNNDELRTIVEEHGAVEKAEVMYDKYSGRSRRFGFVTMKTVEDATAAAEKLNGTQVGGRPIKVNITESPLSSGDASVLQTDDFIDSPYKVYVGNIPSTVTTESLKNFFAEKGNVLSARVSRTPGTSKSSGFGFVTFSSEEDVEAAISSLNNTRLDGQKIRVNKA